MTLTDTDVHKNTQIQKNLNTPPNENYNKKKQTNQTDISSYNSFVSVFKVHQSHENLVSEIHL